jgi:hypothetical protein
MNPAVTVQQQRIVLSCGCMVAYLRATRTLVLLTSSLILFTPGLVAEERPDEISIVSSSNPEPSDQRILGIIPNYQAVSNPDAPFVPLTVKEKWKLFARESLDPFNVGSAMMGAALSQSGNSFPRYGNGGLRYTERFGAAMGDLTSQNFFSAAVLASLLHQDPRYYRKGPQKGILARAGYSVSRLVIARQDSGKMAFNASGVFGMGLGIATSNLYYPRGSRNGEVMISRIGTSFSGGVIGNLLSEFWPDIRTKVLSHFGPWKKSR